MNRNLFIVALSVGLWSVEVNTQAAQWGQCGGTGYNGPTTCPSGWHCQFSNPWYSQCLQGSSYSGGSLNSLPSGSTGSSSTVSTGASSGGRKTGEFHYGAAFGSPYDTSTDCGDIDLISPELLMNWGPDNRHDKTINVCNNAEIKFVPTLWGQTWDNPELGALPDSAKPWGVFLENEPNWFGAYSPDHGDGSNLTAAECAKRYYAHTNLINSKWGVGVVKLLSPSPVNPTYPQCTREHEYGCTYETQINWLNDFFKACPNCRNDIWAINHHEYSCNMGTTKANIQRLWDTCGRKNVFVGELGCNGPLQSVQAQYLTDFAAWAYAEQSLVGFIWAGLNYVGSKNAQMVLNGQLTAVGHAFKDIQSKYPPKLAP